MTEHHDCDGCDDQIRHDEKVVEIIPGFNSHGSLMAFRDQENYTCHHRLSCVEEALGVSE